MSTVFAVPPPEPTPEDTATQTEFDVVLASSVAIKPGGEKDPQPGLLPRRLPSVDELTCDADAIDLDHDLPEPVRDSSSHLLVKDASESFAPPRDLAATSRPTPPLGGLHPVDSHDVVWSEAMAQAEFGVVPVVEMGDFVL
jgi:hypothetical protein